MVQNGKEVLMIRVKQQKDRKQEQGGYMVSATLLSFTFPSTKQNKTIILTGTSKSGTQEETGYQLLRDILATVKL